MKKIKLLLITILTSLTFVSCDVDMAFNTMNNALNVYERYQTLTSRGPALKVTELKDVSFASTRSSISSLLNNVEDMKYITFPGVDAKFRDEVVGELKSKVSSDKLTQNVCNSTECVYSFKDKVVLITKQNGDNIDAVALKGKFSSESIASAISSGDIYKILSFLKK